ncbi:unnamed protein product, partial [Rhizoctonia solani]
MKRKSGTSESSKSSDSTLKARETEKMEASHEVLVEEPKPPASKLPIRILIVGPSGSGKTQMIDDFRHGINEPTINGAYKPTKHVTVRRFRLENEALQLIDTPGFDNTGMSDIEAFTEIAEHLLSPEGTKAGITGMIYIHRAGNTVYSRSLLRNFRVLANIFLGHSGITRLTFLISHSSAQGADYRNISDEIKGRASVFGAAFAAGATIAASPNRAGLIATLRSYYSQAPVILPIQSDDSYRSHATFVARIEKELGYYEYKSAQSLLDGLEQQLRTDYEQRLVGQRDIE